MRQYSLLLIFLVTLLRIRAEDVQARSELGKGGDGEDSNDIDRILHSRDSPTNGTAEDKGVALENTTVDNDDKTVDYTITTDKSSSTTTLAPTQNVTTTDATVFPPSDTTTQTSTTIDSSTPLEDTTNTTIEKEPTLSPSETPPLPVAHEGLATWAVVVVAMLIFFAVILTALSFLRRYLIRRRRDDQRKLLHSSASSEGFFYGDGSGSVHSARFHDSI